MEEFTIKDKKYYVIKRYKYYVLAKNEFGTKTCFQYFEIERDKKLKQKQGGINE